MENGNRETSSDTIQTYHDALKIVTAQNNRRKYLQGLYPDVLPPADPLEAYHLGREEERRRQELGRHLLENHASESSN